MKRTLLLFIVSAICTTITAQIAIPTAASHVVVPCGTNNYTATATTGAGGTGVEWFSDYLCTASLGTNANYNGATATSTMIYCKSTNGAASSDDPKQVYIFKPQIPTASFTTSSTCTGLDIIVAVDTILDSLTTIVLEDATIDPNVPGTNYDNNFLMIRPQGFCGGNVNFLSKYDVGVIPPNVTPVYSESSITAYSGFAHGGNGTVYEQFVADDTWDETTVTYGTSPLPALPNNTADHIGSWWVWYGFPSLTVAHYNASTMGTSDEGDKYRRNTNALLNQQVITERAGDQTLSMYHFSPGYDSRYYAKNHKTNASLLPQLKTIFAYNDAASCTYSWTGPGGFTATTKDISNLTQSGLYVLTITSPFGCIGTMNANIVAPPGAIDIDPITDIIACDSVQLPVITGTGLTAGVAYYTGLGGTGTAYNAGDWITTSGTYYAYDQTGTIPNCTDEEAFIITINQCGCVSTLLSETFDQGTIIGANGPVLYGNGGSNHNAAYPLSGTFFGWFNIQNGIGPVDIYDRTVNGLSIGCTIDASIWVRETYGGSNVDISLIDGGGAVLATTNLTLNGVYQQITLSAVATSASMRYLIHFNGVGGNGLDIIAEDLLITQTCDPGYSTDLQTACNSFTWTNGDGNTYNTSNNTATHTIVAGAANGCDSIITLDLTISNSANSIDTQSTCGPITWIDGNNYAASNNTATHTIVGGAVGGCDSVITLNLTVNSSVNSTDVQTTCGPITWIDGNNYAASNNTATHTIVGGAANGCDSIVTLNLTVNSVVNSIDAQTACDSYTWIDGNNYVASNNTATHTIAGGAANGCDSIVTLNLTVNYTANSVDVQTACDSYTWIDGNNYVASNNAATHTIVGGAAGGCDSIITLDLTVNYTANSIDAITSCGPYTWIDGNNYAVSNNTAVHTIIGGANGGCDSIITLNLIVNNSVNSIDAHTVCDSYTWIDGNNYTTSNNTAIHTINGGASNGCDSIVTLNLTVNNTPIIASPTNTIVCDNYTLPGLTVGNYYTGQIGSGAQLAAGGNVTTAGSNTVYIYAETGTTPNCFSENSFTVSIVKTPTIDLVNDTTICLDQTFLLAPVVNGNVSYLWQDNSIDNTFLVEEEGTYTVEAILAPCPAAKDSVTISFEDCNCYAYLPNSFTPNGDSKNDEFKAVYSCDFKSFNLAIYDRWGEKLFETSNPGNGWNGTFRGKIVPTGVYVCKVNYKGSDNIDIEKVTKVVLVE